VKKTIAADLERMRARLEPCEDEARRELLHEVNNLAAIFAELEAHELAGELLARFDLLRDNFERWERSVQPTQPNRKGRP